MKKKLLKALELHQTIGIFSHTRPDGDALGSQVALCLWLQQMGKTVYAFNQDPFPSNLAWMETYFPVNAPDSQNVEKCDAYIFLDGNQLVRFGSEAEKLKKSEKPCYMIDHHPDPDTGFDLSISVPGKSSTAELVYELICEYDSEGINPMMAKALYTAIMTDTGSFRFDSVTAQTHRVIAHLIEAGRFSPNEIHEAVFDNNEVRHLHLLGAALKNVRMFHSNQLATISVTQAMFDEVGCHQSDTEGLVSYPLSLNNTKAAFLLYEMEGKVKISLRSKNTIDVNKVARRFNGGGHERAAGAWHPGPLEKAVDDIVEAAAQELNEVKKG